MKISEQNKILDSHYQKEIKAKEEKIKEVKDAYNKEIQRIKVKSEEDIRENRNLERERIAKEFEQEKEKWEDVRKKWVEKDAALENAQQLEEVKNTQEVTLNRFRHGKEMESDQLKFDNDINSLRERRNKILREMQETSDSKIYQEEIKSRKNIESLRKEKEQKENLAIKSYANFSSAQQREIDQAIADKEREHRKIIRNAQVENSRQLNERERINQENLKRIDEANKNKLQQADVTLQKKVKQVQKESEDAISTLSLKTQKEINNLKQNESKNKNIISNKASDPFYSITNLNPRITDYEKEYILKISVPEHEKDSVIVDADGRNLKISHNRRYSDEARNEDGTLSKSSRSETVSQSIKLGDLVNPRKITQTYDGNEIIFKIPKA